MDPGSLQTRPRHPGQTPRPASPQADAKARDGAIAGLGQGNGEGAVAAGLAGGCGGTLWEPAQVSRARGGWEGAFPRGWNPTGPGVPGWWSRVHGRWAPVPPAPTGGKPRAHFALATW